MTKCCLNRNTYKTILIVIRQMFWLEVALTIFFSKANRQFPVTVFVYLNKMLSINTLINWLMQLDNCINKYKTLITVSIIHFQTSGQQIFHWIIYGVLCLSWRILLLIESKYMTKWLNIWA